MERLTSTVCGNLVKLPFYQRHGATGQPMKWPFEEADKDGVEVYLETDLAVTQSCILISVSHAGK
jgi:hypothetical protein